MTANKLHGVPPWGAILYSCSVLFHKAEGGLCIHNYLIRVSYTDRKKGKEERGKGDHTLEIHVHSTLSMHYIL